MFKARLWLTRLLAHRTLLGGANTSPDTMPLREWADLPPYHPICDSVPR